MLNVIELKNINQSYENGAVHIIKDLNFVVPKNPGGRTIVILGPSGCGKSTLLRFISGIDKPTSGEAYVNQMPSFDRKTVVGQVFQKYSSLPWLSVLDNVALGLEIAGVKKKERRDRARQMIEKIGLAGHEDKFAQYPLLSGGQLQRVAIGRSLLSNPDVLLMDEPFGALDINTRRKMQVMLLNIGNEFKNTIVFVTHDIAEAVFLADEIYVMGNAPSNFVAHYEIGFGDVRDISIKRSTEFRNYVDMVENDMEKLEK